MNAYPTVYPSLRQGLEDKPLAASSSAHLPEQLTKQIHKLHTR